LLPWNTAKTDIDLNNKAYQFALDEMRKFTAKWRSFANKLKIAKRSGEEFKPLPKPLNKKVRHDTISINQPVDNTNKKKINKNAPKEDHNEYTTVLPQDIAENKCKDKLLSLVHEAKEIDIMQFSYASMALTRILYETSVIDYLTRHGFFKKLKDYCIASREQKKCSPLNEKEKGNLNPKMEELNSFIEKNSDVFGVECNAHIKTSHRRVAYHMPMLNGVMHNHVQTISRFKALEIRDELLPVLRHFIEE